MPVRKNLDELPSTIRRSGSKAQRTWAKAHDSAVATYGEGQRAHRTAFAALKHTHEKVGDHWEPKPGGRKGPSDAQAAKGGRPARRGGATRGGVDVRGRTKAELYDRAKQLDIGGRSSMSKDDLAKAIDKANRKATRKART